MATREKNGTIFGRSVASKKAGPLSTASKEKSAVQVASSAAVKRPAAAASMASRAKIAIIATSSVSSKKPAAASSAPTKKKKPGSEFLAPPHVSAVHPRRRLSSGTPIEVRRRRALDSGKRLDVWVPGRVITASGNYYSVKCAADEPSSSTDCRVLHVPFDDVREARLRPSTATPAAPPMKRPLPAPEPAGAFKRQKATTQQEPQQPTGVISTATEQKNTVIASSSVVTKKPAASISTEAREKKAVISSSSVAVQKAAAGMPTPAKEEKVAAVEPEFLAPSTVSAAHPPRRLAIGTAVEVRTRRAVGSRMRFVIWLPGRLIGAADSCYAVECTARDKSSSTACRVLHVPFDDVREAHSPTSAPSSSSTQPPQQEGAIPQEALERGTYCPDTQRAASLHGPLRAC